MSDYQHDRHKFADLGLQLRLPVDLVPANQYSLLTNVIPVIEGELRTRAGLTFIANLFSIAANATLGTPDSSVPTATLATTIYPHGFNTGDTVSLVVTGNDPTGPNTITLGTYTVVITVIDPFNFSFTPGIAAVWVNMNTTASVFAQAIDTASTTTLPQSAIITLFRLNESLPTYPSARIAAIQPGRLFIAPIPDGTVFNELVLPSLAGEPPSQQNGFSANPFSIVGFRFTDDPASWAIIANPNKMVKFRYAPNGGLLAFLLGNPIPPNPATAVEGSTGNLNSTGGTEYDWRYTYYDGYVNTEGNPSASPDSGTVTTQLATLTQTPDPTLNNYNSHGGFYQVTNSSWGGVSTTSGMASVLQNPSKTGFNIATARWYGFTNPATTSFISTLNVSWQAQLTGNGVVTLNYSTNGGTSFNYFSVAQSTFNSGPQNTTLILPLGTDLTQVVFQAIAEAPPWFINGTYQPTWGASVTITNIEIDTNLDPTPNTLALVNKMAIVTVQLPGALNDGRVTGIRLYRRGGSLPDAWRLVGTFPLSGLVQVPTVKLAGAGANDGTFGSPSFAWTAPGNVASTSLFATCPFPIPPGVAYSNWLYTSLHGFSIASGTPIQGITVTFNASQTGLILNGTFVVTLLRAGVPIGVWNGTTGGTPVGSVHTSTGSSIPTSSTVFTFGGPADVWGTSLTADDVSAPTFGVAILYVNPPGAHTTISVNNVNVSIFDGFADIIDNIGDAVLETQPILELDNDQPVTSISTLNQPLPFIWGPVGLEARLLGVGDPNRPECVYFSKPGNPDAWPPENFLEVSDPGTPMVAGCTYNTRVYAFSRERVYELVEGVVPTAVFAPFPTPSAHGLFTPWGLAIGPAIYFVAKDGIYETTGGQENSIVENDIKPIFPTYDTPGQAVETYDAVDMTQPDLIRLTYYNSELYFVYQGVNSGTLQLLIYDILKKRWRGAAYATYASVPYAEPNTTSSLLLGMQTGSLYENGGNQDPGPSGQTAISCSLRTGAHDQGMPLNQKQYGNVIFDLDPGGASLTSPVTITPLINGETASEAALVVTGTGRQQIPLDLSDYFAFNTEFQITWQGTPIAGGNVVAPVLYQYDILYFLEPVSVTHWQSQPTSFEFPGFVHLRDGYIAIRSNVDVTLTMTIDTGAAQVVQTYTIPSTSGARRKVYVQFDANKGLLYQLALDSVDGIGQFRVYESDLELRVKPWLGVLGYSIQRTLGGEASSQ